MSNRENWCVVPMKETYIEFHDGPHATPPPADEGAIYLGIKNITDDGRLDFTQIRYIAEADLPRWTKRVVPKSGDIVFAYEATLNRYAIIPENFHGCLGRRLALIRTNPDVVDGRFLYFYFFGHEWRNTVEQKKISGSTVDRIPLIEFPDFEITLPPLETQRKIAAILSAYDDLIENNTRRIKALEQAAHDLYREWFVEFRFQGHESVEMVDSGTDYGMIPYGWEVRSVDESFDILGGGTPSTKNPEYWEDGDVVWFSPSDLTASKAMFISDSTKHINALGLQKSSAKMFPAYSVMMTSRATLGVTAINTVPACTNQGFITCLPNETISAYQIYFWIAENLEKIISVASGATFKEINKTTFRQFPFIIPDADTTSRFVVITEPIGKQIENLLRRNHALREARDLLLPRLVSGQLDVSDVEVGELND